MRQYSKYQVKVFQVFQLDSKGVHMDQVTLVKNQYRLEQWRKLIQECRSSGMKVDDWCEANGVTHHAYYYWLRKIRKAACQKLPDINTSNSSICFKKLEVQTPLNNTQAAVIGKRQIFLRIP